MLRTPSDVVKLVGTISPLQLAFLVRTGAVTHPLRYPAPGSPEWLLFDDDHVEELLTLLGSPRPAERQSGYSDAARRALTRRDPELQAARNDRDIPSKREFDYWDDAAKEKRSLKTRLRSWLTILTGHNPRLSGSDQLRLDAVRVIAAANINAALVALIGPRMLRLDESRADDRCLRVLLASGTRLGRCALPVRDLLSRPGINSPVQQLEREIDALLPNGNQFANELSVVDELLSADEALATLPPVEALARIHAIEKRYQDLVAKSWGYVRENDPERMLAAYLFADFTHDATKRVREGARERQKEFWRGALPPWLRLK